MRKRPLRKRVGFTLMELMVVVIILGILASIAIPTYTKTVEKVKGEKAVTLLMLIRSGERMYMLDYNEFADDLDLLSPYIFTGDLASDPDWNYADPVLDAEGFDATATRSGGSEPYNGGTITINQDGAITSGEDWPFAY